MMRRRLKATLTAATAAALVAVVGMSGCSSEDEAEENGNLVGDWMFHSSAQIYDGTPDKITYADDSPDEKKIISFRSSGEASMWGFQKTGDDWVETPFDSGAVVRWRTDGRTIYLREPGHKEEEWATYAISGNRLVTNSCHYIYDQTTDQYGNAIGNATRIRHCEEVTFTRINDVADVIKSLDKDE